MKPHKLFGIVAVLLFSTVLWMRAAPLALAAAPSNDNIDSAISISALPFTDVKDTSEATSAIDDPNDCYNNGSVWYTFTPGANMRLSANTLGSAYDTTLGVYTGVPGAMSLVDCNDDFSGVQSQIIFDAVGGTTYYFLLGFCCGNGNTGGGNLTFSVEALLPPANDNFAAATVISGLSYSDTADIATATLEEQEQPPSCADFDSLASSVWYSFTPTTNETLSASSSTYETVLAVYTGSGLSDLTEVGCRPYWQGDRLSFAAAAATTYYFQVGGQSGMNFPVQFHLQVTEAPVANFFYYPNPPTRYDEVQFYDYSYDPAGSGIVSYDWDFGDGTTATGCCPSHKFNVDGEYNVKLTVMSAIGKQGSLTQQVNVETHDVAITKFTTPKSGRVGNTSKIVVGINNQFRDETVTVALYRSLPGYGFQEVGTLTQYVPKQENNRTTDFLFSYTFSPEDSANGKVNFRVIAYLQNAQDAFPGDNEAISFATKVTGANAANAELNEVVEEQDSFLLRSQMDENDEMRELFLQPTRWLYMPVIDNIEE